MKSVYPETPNEWSKCIEVIYNGTGIQQMAAPTGGWNTIWSGKHSPGGSMLSMGQGHMRPSSWSHNAHVHTFSNVAIYAIVSKHCMGAWWQYTCLWCEEFNYENNMSTIL